MEIVEGKGEVTQMQKEASVRVSNLLFRHVVQWRSALDKEAAKGRQWNELSGIASFCFRLIW